MRRLLAACCVVLTAAGLAGCGTEDDPGSSTETGASPGASSEPTSSAAATPGAGADESESASASPSVEPSPSSYLPVPARVVLTEQGAALTFGQVATVAWQPRQQVTGALDVTVEAVERTSIERSFSGWSIPEGTETSTPYFVRAILTNRGDTDLGGRQVPLYVANASGTLIEATSFASVYRPCRRGAFPEPFAPGASTKVCLVYFAPEQGGELAGVTFRPTEAFDPLSWTGDVRRLGGGQ